MSTKYETFAALHDDFLILPNAWDAGTARLMHHAGAKAIATSSAAVAWTHGYADGEAMPPELALQTVRAISGAVGLPVSADIEAGYGEDPNVAGERAVQVLEAGAVGINIEDGADAPDLLAAKIEAVKTAAKRKGAQIWVNARTDVYLRKQASGDEALKERSADPRSTAMPVPTASSCQPSSTQSRFARSRAPSSCRSTCWHGRDCRMRQR